MGSKTSSRITALGSQIFVVAILGRILLYSCPFYPDHSIQVLDLVG